MEYFLIFDNKNFVEWNFLVLKFIKKYTSVKVSTIGLDNFNLEKNQKIKYFNFFRLVDKLFGYNQKNKFFQKVDISFDYNVNNVEKLQKIIYGKTNFRLIWIGDTSSMSSVYKLFLKPIWYLSNVTSFYNSVDSAFNSLSSSFKYTYCELKEYNGTSSKIIDFVYSNSHSFSLNFCRNSYSSIAGLVCKSIIRSELNKICSTDEKLLNKKNKKILYYSKFYNLILNLFVQFYNKIIDRLFNPKWILIVYSNNKKLLTNQNISDTYKLNQFTNKTGLADPFIIERQDKTYIFAESIDENGFGKIICFDVNKKENVYSDVIVEKYHLSYPFVFKYNDEIYMIPESSENRTVNLYKSTSFPLKWVFQKYLFENIDLVDSTLLFHNNLWWMFSNSKLFSDSFNEELSIFYSTNPLENWKPHKANPVKTDIRFTRGAGNFIKISGEIYRPVQDCSTKYGFQIHYMKITKLTKFEFQEKLVAKLTPQKSRNEKRTHTINSVEKYTVLDIYKN